MRRAVAQRLAERDGLGEPGIEVAAAAERDRRAGEHGQRGRRPDREPQRPAVRQLAVQVGHLAGIDVGGQRVQLDRRREDGGVVEREFVRVDPFHQPFHVHHRAAAQQVALADQRPGEARIGPAAQALRARAEQPGGRDRPGGRAVDRVERVEQSELVHGQRHSGGDAAAHPAALDRQRHPRPVGAPSRPASARQPLGEQPGEPVPGRAGRKLSRRRHVASPSVKAAARRHAPAASVPGQETGPWAGTERPAERCGKAA
ncbi:MAG TPA: hypothetical protein VH372_13295 [Actinospica sp.]|nr:hypothetical protein [Actinospica sp.]